MPQQLCGLMWDAFGKTPQVLTHYLEHGVYSATLVDYDFEVVVRPPLVLVLTWLHQRGVAYVDARREEYRFKIAPNLAVGYALSHFEQMSADQKLWLADRFKLHLVEAKAAGTEMWRTVCLSAKKLEEEWRNHL